MKLPALWFTLLVLSSFSASATVYHVDADTGDDAHDGSTIKTPWKTLEHVNAQVFQAGDEVRFKAGTHYSGQLKPQGSGKLNEDHSVVLNKIGMYGSGEKPRIDGAGLVLDTLLINNVEFWDVRDLELTNLGTNRQPSRTGVRIVVDKNFGAMRHIQLSNLFVHDVNGDLHKEREGCGIFFENRGGNDSHFDGLLIENCHLARTDRNGICQRGGGRARSLHVVIRGNLLEDIGGDGIKLWGSNGGLVEHNVIHGGRMRCDDYAAGIWPFSCDDSVIQFNEVSGMHGTKDGQGFDSDYQCHRSLFQYNYSHNNDGGFILICGPGNSYNDDTVVRYNISQNDGEHDSSVFHFGGTSKNAAIYNNTIYLGPKQDVPLLAFTDWSGGKADGTQFLNNIFYADGGRVTYAWGKSTNTLFVHNIFYGNHAEIPADPHAITNRPSLAHAGSGAAGMESLAGYQSTDRDFPRGQFVPNNGGRDFFGHTLPANQPPTIGAGEGSN